MTARRFTQSVAWLLAAVLCCAAPLARADYGAKPKPQPKPAKAPVAAKPAPAESTTAAAAGPKYYRYKGEKKGNVAGAQVMTLLVEDVFTGKSETLYVPNNDAASKTYDPLTSVADALKELEPGTIVQIDTEKQKGKPTVKSVAKADVKPGEELPNGYVFVQSATEEAKGGGPAPTTVTLSKFGREVKVGVPMWKDRDQSDAKWEPDPKIDDVVRKLKAGDVVLAQIKSGKQPMLATIFEYQKPERGKFIGVKDVQFKGAAAAGFEIEGSDGTAVTFTLEGTEQTKNNKTTYVPNPQQLRTVQKLKKGAEVEVHYRLDGTTWVMQQVTVLNGAEAKPAAASAKAGPADDAGTMKDDKAEKAGDEKKAEKPAKS